MMDRNVRWIFHVLATSLISIGLFLATTINFRQTVRPMINPVGLVADGSSRSQLTRTPTDVAGFDNNSSTSDPSSDLSTSFWSLLSPKPTTSSSSSSSSSSTPSSSSSSTSSVLSSVPPSSSSSVSGDQRGGVDGQLSAESLPVVAYFLTGTKGDGNRMKRLLLALYHPHNEYLLHLDRESPAMERLDLARFVTLHPTFLQVGNVHVIVKSNLVTYRGPTMISTTLHGMSVLLRKNSNWDWFINLSASDYPLITQDDFLHVLSSVPRNLNFLEHSSAIPEWKEKQRVRPIVIDPAIYRSSKSDLFFATQRRATPNAFRLFEGSAWMMLSRSFCEYLITGWDNLPRLALMYFANVVSSPESYFHTVVCNSKEFFNTTVNTDLHYIAWDNPPKQHPLSLNASFYEAMMKANVPFARKFKEHEPLLDTIDAELLRGREKGRFVEGGWCGGGEFNKGKGELGKGGRKEIRSGGAEETVGRSGNNNNNSSSSSSSGGSWYSFTFGKIVGTTIGGGGGEGGGAEGGGGGGVDRCLVVGDPTALKPGEGATRFEKLILHQLEPQVFRERQCV